MSGATGLRKAQLDLLRWHVDAGVDLALDERPHNRLSKGRQERLALARRKQMQVARVAAIGRAEPPRPPAPVIGRVHGVPPEEAALSAREVAAGARTLDELRAAMDRFEGCALKSSASRLVFGDGTAGARLMLVGEAPGREEDREGVPFVGRAGQLLDRMLAAIGLDRGSVYIANVVPWRPPGNRTPTPQETAICKPFVARQIELVAPDVLVCLGGPSSQTLLNIRTGILSARGRWAEYRAGERTIRAMAMLHPAYLLRTPSAKRLAWADLLAVRQALAADAKAGEGF